MAYDDGEPVITDLGTDAEVAAATVMQQTLTAAIVAEDGVTSIGAAAEIATGEDGPDESGEDA